MIPIILTFLTCRRYIATCEIINERACDPPVISMRISSPSSVQLPIRVKISQMSLSVLPSGIQSLLTNSPRDSHSAASGACIGSEMQRIISSGCQKCQTASCTRFDSMQESPLQNLSSFGVPKPIHDMQRMRISSYTLKHKICSIRIWRI